MLKKLIKMIVLTLLAYLLQATIARRIAVGGVAPNLALVLISIVTVAFGRKYTFAMSLAIGYMMEIMLPALEYINLVLYPVCAMLGALAFSDKSERRLEEQQTRGKPRRQLNPHLRTPLCALLSIAVFEGVHVLYTYLTGVSLGFTQYSRALIDIAYTTALTAVLQFPVRRLLGVYKVPKAR